MLSEVKKAPSTLGCTRECADMPGRWLLLLHPCRSLAAAAGFHPDLEKHPGTLEIKSVLEFERTSTHETEL